MRIQEHISLKELTTMKVGGTARYFCSVKKTDELSEALSFARTKKVPYAVLGGGSNVLISEGEFQGLLIKIEIKGMEWVENPPPSIPPLSHHPVSPTRHPSSGRRGVGKEKDGGVLVVAGAGESWDGLVAKAVKRGLWGIENLSGIPGTLGAAPIQNIGAYGTEIRETLQWVEVFDAKTGTLRKLSNKACKFGYRDSIFKHPAGKSLIVARVALRLQKNGRPNLEYKDLKHYFYGESHSSFAKGGGESASPVRGFISNGASRRISKSLGFRPLPLRKGELPTLSNIRRAVLEIRSRKFPDLQTCGTAGSFFRNPIISKRQFNALKKKFPDLPGFPICDPNQRITPESAESKKQSFGSFGCHSGHWGRIKIPLAWILDNLCNLKGYAKGNVRLFEKQPIVLVQSGAASCEEIKSFANEVAKAVKEKTGIAIEWEVQKIN